MSPHRVAVVCVIGAGLLTLVASTLALGRAQPAAVLVQLAGAAVAGLGLAIELRHRGR